MPDSLSVRGQGPYSQPPDDDVLRAFKRHVRETGKPQTFPNVIEGRIDPALDHRLVERFEVHQRFRADGGMIPCSICSEGPKFWEGRLMWSPDGWLRVVGHCCAENLLGTDRYERQIRENTHKQVLREAEIYLIENYRLVGPLRAYANQLRIAGSTLVERRQLLRDRVRPFCDFLDRQIIQGRQFPLSRKLPKGSGSNQGFRSSTGGASAEEEYWVGSIRGQPIFGSKGWNPEALASRIVKKLPPDHDTAEGMTKYVFGASKELRVSQARALRDAPQQLIKLYEEMRDARTFLTTEYLEEINAWLNHPHCRYRQFSLALHNPRIVGFRTPGDYVNINRLDNLAIQPAEKWLYEAAKDQGF